MPHYKKNISLYNESQAKDNCGFGLIVNRHGTSNREVVKKSIVCETINIAIVSPPCSQFKLPLWDFNVVSTQ